MLAPLLKAATPVVWFVNLFVQGLLKLLRIRPPSDAGATLTQEELRSLVLEGQYFRGKHRAMLANLFDLEAVTVDDVMTPRNQIHALDLAAKPALLRQQLATSYHTRLPVYEGTLDNIVGVLHLKQVVHLQRDGEIDPERAALAPAPGLLRSGRHAAAHAAAAVPERPPAPGPRRRRVRRAQGPRHDRGHHRGDHRRVHDAGARRRATPTSASADGSVVVDGMAPLRTLNRRLGTHFPLDGPKTLNGLIVDAPGRHPRGGHARSTSPGRRSKSLQTQDRGVKVVRLLPPVGGGRSRLYKARTGRHHRPVKFYATWNNVAELAVCSRHGTRIACSHGMLASHVPLSPIRTA